MAGFYGAAMLGYGALTWLAKDSEGSSSRCAVSCRVP
jgi:hypothetical protein